MVTLTREETTRSFVDPVTNVLERCTDNAVILVVRAHAIDEAVDPRRS